MPVADVFKRIQVRDPNRRSSGGYARRSEDFEIPWRLSQTVTHAVVATLVVGGLYWMQTRKPASLPELKPAAVPTQARRPAMQPLIQPIPDIPLSIPSGMHPTPQALQRPSAAPAPIGLMPGRLNVDFLGPRTLEVRWDSPGDGYRYLLYAATSSTLEDAQPVLEQSVAATHALWIPDEEIQWAWLAVKAIGAGGEETLMSRPLLVQLPPL